LKGKKGFTLIELMIVVAIIGILAAIAIPNLIKFSCKSKQSEAKQSLGSIFNAMQAYFSDNDTFPFQANFGGTDFGCWALMSWAPSGQTRYSYQCADGSPVVDPPDETTDFLTADSKQSRTDCPTLDAGLVTASTGTGFTVGAVANLDTDIQCCDHWAVNDEKLIRNQLASAAAWGVSMNDCSLDTCP
jgi:type IV pilus assembly protein PilA